MARPPRRVALRAFVGAVVIAGAAASALVVGPRWHEGVGDVQVLIAFFVAVSLANVFPIAFEWKGETEHVSVEEAFYAALVIVAPSPAAFVAMMVATTVGNLYNRRPLLKAAFNTGIFALATSLAIMVSERVAGDVPTGTELRGLLAAAAGAVVIYAVTTLSVRLVIVVAQPTPLRSLFTGMNAMEAMIMSSSLSMGLLVGLATDAYGAAIVLAFAPMTVIGVVLHQHARAIRDRRQLDTLLHTAIDAQRAASTAGVRDLLLDATRTLLRTGEARLDIHPAIDGELSSTVETDATWLYLTAGSRRRGAPFEASDQVVLDALAAIGSVAMGSTELLDRVRHQAFHDALTGLPNRLLFEDRARQALATIERSGGTVGLLFVDLDRFKRINDSLGHHAGDELLKQVGLRLQSLLRGGDSAARMGGDEFAILIPTLGSADDALAIASRLRTAMHDPFVVDGRELFITASVGVAVAPMDGLQYESLLRDSDMAMYDAKSAGRDAVRRSRVHVDGGSRLGLEGDLRKAIDRGELWIAYQPQFEVASGSLVGAEALVRWNHPERGQLRPDEFLAVAEEIGIMGDIDAWVLENACAEAMRWRTQGARPIRVAVNVSSRPVHSGAILDVVEQALITTGLPAEDLEIEVTERVTNTDAADAVALQAVRDMGVRVAIDDFGTGYSGLSRLQAFTADMVKIDRSFVREIVDARSPAPLVTSTISLARELGIEVMAEGVETGEQLRFLRDKGCDLAQGYLLGRPGTGEALLQLARRADVSVAGRTV